MPDDSSSNSTQSELLKQQEESHRREIEREKMEKVKYQQKIKEMEKQLSQLSTIHSTREVK